MSDELRAPVVLSKEQLKQLQEATNGGAANYPQGYGLIHGWIKDNTAAQKDGTVFWFQQAAGINSQNSLSSQFIRRHTENGLDIANVPQSERKDMQVLSNMIAEKVIKDVLKVGNVESLAVIISKDIRVALDDGKVKLGGCGGSFYYWNQPFNDNPRNPFPRDPDGSYHTIGEEITKLGQKELLLQTSSLTVKQMILAGEIGLNQLPEMGATSWDAGLPLTMQMEISRRAIVMLKEYAGEELEKFPGELERLLKKQGESLLDKAIDRVQDAVRPNLPRIPQISDASQPDSSSFSKEDQARLNVMLAKIDEGLSQNRLVPRDEPMLADTNTQNKSVYPSNHPANEAHPQHSIFNQIQTLVHAEDAKLNRQPDADSERLALSMTTLAAKDGFSRVDHLVFSVDKGLGVKAGENVFIVQGELNNPAHDRAYMKTTDALNTPVAASLHSLEANNQQQVLAQQQAQQQIQQTQARGPITV